MQTSFRALTVAVYLCLTAVVAVGQDEEIKVDIVSNGNSENVEFPLRDLVKNAIAREENPCLAYDLAESFEEATAPYVIELWDSEEYLEQFMFKDKRERTVQQVGNRSVKETYIAAGIRVRAHYKIIGRLVERETDNVVDVFTLGGIIDREIYVPEVESKFRVGMSSANRSLEAKILVDYGDEITRSRDETIQEVQATLLTAMQTTLSANVLPHAEVSGIVKQKKDKVKSVSFDFCDEVQLYRHGTIGMPLIVEEEVAGYKAYRNVATYFKDPKNKVFRIGRGQSDLLPLIQSGARLLGCDEDAVLNTKLAANKIDGYEKVSFVLQYPMIHNYTDFDRKYIELLFQSSLIGYRSIGVVGHDAFTASLNNTFAGAFEREERDSTDLSVDEIVNSNQIWVTIDELYRNPDDTKWDKIGCAVSEGKDDEENLILYVKKRARGLDFGSDQIKYKNLRDSLLDRSVEIVGVCEEKKGKIKSIYVRGVEPLDSGDEYYLYDTDKIGKKTKPVAEFKVKDLLSTQLAIAKVTEGDKEIGELLKKQYYIIPEESGGFTGNEGPPVTSMKSYAVKDDYL